MQLLTDDEFFKRSIQLDLRHLRIYAKWVFLQGFQPFKSLFVRKKFQKILNLIQEQKIDLLKQSYIYSNKLSHIEPKMVNPKSWVEIKKCPKCNSIQIKWYLSATKECKDCGYIFRAEELIEKTE